MRGAIAGDLRWRRAACLALSAAVGASAWVMGGSAGLGYLLAYTLVSLPGWPLGFRLLGWNAAGLVAGATLGYALSCLLVWLCAAAGATGAGALVLVWAGAGAAIWLPARRARGPLVDLAWSRRDTTALVVVLLLAPALFWFPYRNLGARDAAGERHYRAYFTADFLWHMALTAELAKFERPPANPYMGDQPVHYYWTYFLVPAAVSARGPSLLRDVETALKVNAFASSLLFLGMLLVATRAAVPHTRAAAAAAALAAVAASAEGFYALYDTYARGRPLAALADLNVDAVTAWWFGGLRIDGIPRGLWYTPQHSMACALGLIALPVAGLSGWSAPVRTVLMAGVALAFATAFNPLLGGTLSLIYGLVVLADLVWRRLAVSRIAVHALAAGAVAAAIVWSLGNEMVEGAGAALRIGWQGFARQSPLLTLLLSLGPLLVPGLAGLALIRKPPRRLWPAIVGVLAGLGLLYFVSLAVEGSYVGFRAGQVLQVSLAPLVALCLSELKVRGAAGRLATRLTAGAVLALGLPTTIIDTFNAQDIGNRRMGPGFRWTVSVTPQEQDAFEWIKRATPADAVVQMDPIARGRETWTQIPTFAARRMHAGLPISLLNAPEYERRSRAVRETIYATADVRQAWDAAVRMDIDYIYLDRVERGSLPPDALAKFDVDPLLFRRVFVNEEAAVYAVVRPTG